jgi:hypothetical protein
MQAQTITERQLIKRFCEQHGIVMLLHFTRIENLAGILREGLIPRRELERRAPSGRPVFCDHYRKPWYDRANCLSISFPNSKMFYMVRKRSPSAKWVVLKIKPNVLWELDCAFCFKNAWSRQLRAIGLPRLKSYESFVGLFGRYGRRPLNRQAEVLVFNRMEFPEFIEWVYFQNAVDRTQWKTTDGQAFGIGSSVDARFFR